MVGNIVKLALCVLVGLGFFVNGARGLYTYAVNQNPQELSCAEYLADPPDAQWLTLTDCYPRVDDLAFSSNFDDDVDEVFVPLAASEDAEGPITLVLATEDQEWVDIINEIESSTDGELPEAVLSRAQALFGARTFSGSLQTGDSDRDKLRDVLDDVSSDAALIEHNERPDWAFALAFALGGLALFGFGVRSFVRVTGRRRRVIRATNI